MRNTVARQTTFGNYLVRRIVSVTHGREDPGNVVAPVASRAQVGESASQSAIHCSSEDVSDPARLLSGIDPEGDRWVGVAEASSDHMHGHAGE